MTGSAAVRDQIAEALGEFGIRGRGSIWRVRGSQVQWVVRLDHLPRGHRFGIDIGLDLQTNTARRLPTDCAILLHLENLPGARDLPIPMTLALDSNLPWDERLQVLDVAGRVLGAFISDRLTLSDIRASFRAGDFDSAIIVKDARTVLETEDEHS